MLCRVFKAFTVLIVFMMLAGCSSAKDKSGDDFPSNLPMMPQDLPKGWTRGGVYFDEVPNAQDIKVAYVGSPNPKESHILVTHQLAVYETDLDAENEYPKWEDKWFSTDKLIPPEGWSFQPQDDSDPFKFGCLNQTINEKPFLVCRYLQRHKNAISLVLANLDGETLNLEQFANTLTSLDVRMNQWK